MPGRLLALVLTALPCLFCLQVLFSRYCPLLDTGLTLGMRLLYTSVTWCYGELQCLGFGPCAAVYSLACGSAAVDMLQQNPQSCHLLPASVQPRRALACNCWWGTCADCPCRSRCCPVLSCSHQHCGRAMLRAGALHCPGVRCVPPGAEQAVRPGRNPLLHLIHPGDHGE